jgi:hypothetical protein
MTTSPSRRNSLYDISAEIMALAQQREFAEEEGDAREVERIDGELMRYLNENLPAKVDSIRGYLMAQGNAAEVHKAEAQYHIDQARRANDNIKRVKQMCVEVMTHFGHHVYRGVLHSIRRVANGGVRPLVIRQPELVPIEFEAYAMRMNGRAHRYMIQLCAGAPQALAVLDSATHVPDTAMIRAALERGESVPGCELGERGEHVRVQ